MKHLSLLIVSAILFMMTGCVYKGTHLVDYKRPVPKTALKNRFYLYQTVDEYGIAQSVSNARRKQLERFYPKIFTTDPKDSILIEERVSIETTTPGAFWTFLSTLACCGTLGVFPSYSYEETTYRTTYRCLPANTTDLPAKQFSQKYLPSVSANKKVEVATHVGMEIFAPLFAPRYMIRNEYPERMKHDLMNEHDAKFIATTLLTDASMRALIDSNQCALVANKKPSPKPSVTPTLKSTPKTNAVATAPVKKIATGTVYEPTDLPPFLLPDQTKLASTTAKQTYRVVLDNFNNETGIGEYAVVFVEPPTFVDTRNVRNTVFNYAKELFCSIRSNIEIENIDVVSWQGGFETSKGENYYAFTMSLAAVTPFDLSYDNKTRRGYIKARVEGVDIEATMRWAQHNIEALVNRYNRTILAGEQGIPSDGSYIFEREEITNDGYYIFHFKVVN